MLRKDIRLCSVTIYLLAALVACGEGNVSHPDDGAKTNKDGGQGKHDGSPSSSSTIVLNTLKAFPTAEGGGAVSNGGRGGDVYWVTNAEYWSDGSFSKGVDHATGVPRTIMFAIGGAIALGYHPSSDSSNITIAGQSAHALGGIYWDADNSDANFMYLGAEDSIVRYIGTRGFRGLDGYDGDPLIWFKGSQVILDHISDLGGVQGLSSRDGVNCTIQYSLYTESQYKEHDTGVQWDISGYPEGKPEGYLDYIYNANLLKSHRFPAPYGDSRVKIRMVNNYVYGWGTRHVNAYGGVRLDAIYNVFEEGHDFSNHLKSETFAMEPQALGSASVHLHDNWHLKNNGDPLFAIDNSIAMFHYPGGGEGEGSYRETPLMPYNELPYLVHSSAADVKGFVLKHAGASVRYKANGVVSTENPTEIKFKDWARNKDENQFSSTERTALPDMPMQSRTLTEFEREQGFSESWAVEHGLDIHSADIRNQTKLDWKIQGYTIKNNAGYTNLEMYLAELAGDFHMLASRR